MASKILVVGSLNMDLVATAPRMPQLGETLTGDSFATYPGGKGANQAVAAARMGAEVTLVGAVGEDDYGNRLLSELHRDGIDTRRVARIPDVTTGVALITVTSGGQNAILVIPGANGAVKTEALDLIQEEMVTFDLVLLQLELPMETVLSAAALAKTRGRKVILNPAPYQPLPEALIPLVDVLLVNEIEARQLSGQDHLSPSGRMAALKTLGFPVVLMTAGGQGVYYSGDGQEGHLPAAQVTPVDTTAAGDTFAGAFAAFWQEKGLQEACKLAVKAAGIAVTRHGAQSSIPYKSELF